MTIDNLINWLEEAEDNNTWLVSTQSVKRHLEKIKETEQLNLTDVSQQRELFYNFITWYNAKPKLEKNKDGLVTIGVIDEFLKL